jgi:hypothetical protein
VGQYGLGAGAQSETQKEARPLVIAEVARSRHQTNSTRVCVAAATLPARVDVSHPQRLAQHSLESQGWVKEEMNQMMIMTLDFVYVTTFKP